MVADSHRIARSRTIFCFEMAARLTSTKSAALAAQCHLRARGRP